EDAKNNPGQIDLGTTTGSFTHIQMLNFEQEAGIDFNFVDAGDFAERNSSLLGGHIDVVPIQLGLANEYIESGDMKSLGVLSENRLDMYPEVPTFMEEGVDISFEKFFFTAVPQETPDEVVDVLSEAISNVVNNEEYLEQAEGYGLEPQFINQEETLELMSDNLEKYETIIENDE